MLRAPSRGVVELGHIHALHRGGQLEQRLLAVQALRAAAAQAVPDLHQQLLSVAQREKVAKVGKRLCPGKVGSGLGGWRGAGQRAQQRRQVQGVIARVRRDALGSHAGMQGQRAHRGWRWRWAHP